MSARAAAFPWGSLETVGPSRAQAESRARRAASKCFDAANVEEVLSTLLSTPVSVAPLRADGRNAEAVDPGRTCVWGRLGTHDVWLRLAVEPALATAALAQLIEQVQPIEGPTPTLEPRLLGAFEALTVELGRRLSRTQPVELVARDVWRQQVSASAASVGVEYSLAVHLLGRRFAAELWLTASDSSQPTNPRLADLGSVRIQLPLVAAVCRVSRNELATLQQGDVWLLGEAWWIDEKNNGKLALLAANAEHGHWLDVRDDVIVLGEPTPHLSWEIEMEKSAEEQTLEDTVLRAPVVVRVEVGSLAMAAQDWAKLQVGDVIQTGTRVKEPVTLRVAGEPIASGELVVIDGQLGVRITQLGSA